MWQSLAHHFFENRLPLITIEWSTRLTASAGLFVSQIGPRSWWASRDYRQGAARVIRLSAPLLRDQPEEELRRTLAHEMIHQWQFDIRHCRPNHGSDFLSMMHRMNQDGLGVSLYHHLDEAVQSWIRYAWHCVQCGYEYQRQRRTIRPTRHRCGQCGGRLKEADLKVSELNDMVENVQALEPVGMVGAVKGKANEVGQLLLPF